MFLTHILRKCIVIALRMTAFCFDIAFKAFAYICYLFTIYFTAKFRWRYFFSSIMVNTHLLTKARPVTTFNTTTDPKSTIAPPAQSQTKHGAPTTMYRTNMPDIFHLATHKLNYIYYYLQYINGILMKKNGTFIVWNLDCSHLSKYFIIHHTHTNQCKCQLPINTCFWINFYFASIPIFSI